MIVTIPDTIAERLRAEVARHPYPLVFATISGAHLYGFPSPDSDFDLRGTHILPVDEVVGLDPGPETVQLETKDDVLELDLVTHDVKKFFALLLKKNDYALELRSFAVIANTLPIDSLTEFLGKSMCSAITSRKIDLLPT